MKASLAPQFIYAPGPLRVGTRKRNGREPEWGARPGYFGR